MSRIAFGPAQTALVFLAVMAGLSVIGVTVGLLLERGVSRAEKPASFTAVQTRVQIPPEPRLQVDPLADRQVVLGPERQASTWGWADRARGRAHVPVDVAMRMLAGRGWPQPEAGR